MFYFKFLAMLPAIHLSQGTKYFNHLQKGVLLMTGALAITRLKPFKTQMKTEKRIEQFHFEKKEVEREKQIKDVERMADKESRKKETDKGNMKTDQNKKKKQFQMYSIMIVLTTQIDLDVLIVRKATLCKRLMFCQQCFIPNLLTLV